MPVEIADAVYPAEAEAVRYCIDRFLGIPVSGTAVVQVKDTRAVADWTSKSVMIDLAVLTVHRFAGVSALCLFVLLSTLSLRSTGTTPGKKVMRLRVVGRVPLPAFRREMVRNLPYILSAGAVRMVFEYANAGTEMPAGPDLTIAALLGVSICAAVYRWVWPMLRWKGALTHDRRLGLRVAHNAHRSDVVEGA